MKRIITKHHVVARRTFSCLDDNEFFSTFNKNKDFHERKQKSVNILGQTDASKSGKPDSDRNETGNQWDNRRTSGLGNTSSSTTRSDTKYQWTKAAKLQNDSSDFKENKSSGSSSSIPGGSTPINPRQQQIERTQRYQQRQRRGGGGADIMRQTEDRQMSPQRQITQKYEANPGIKMIRNTRYSVHHSNHWRIW